MTTIAWDGVTLSADRKRTIHNTPIAATKIFRGKHRDGMDLLFGCSGDSCECEAFKQWQAGRGGRPTFKYFHVICIDQERRIWVAEEAMLWLRVPRPQWAIGSGADYAMGAMLAGKPAAAAVRIACELDNGSGLGVDTLRFINLPGAAGNRRVHQTEGG